VPILNSTGQSFIYPIHLDVKPHLRANDCHSAYSTSGKSAGSFVEAGIPFATRPWRNLFGGFFDVSA